MYDVPGGDSGHEWVEVTNTGSEPVDISKFKFAEGGTNHALKIISGTSTLAAGSSAIIADNAATFAADWPSYVGTLFDSTFSLSNTGETLAIKNASSSLEDSISYSSSVGANGDGGSLHRSGDTFVAALPNPGVYPGVLKSVPVVAKATPTPAPVKTKTSTSKSSSASSKTAAVAVYPQDTFNNFAQPTSTPIPLTLWIVGVIALIGLAVAGAVYARLQRSTAYIEKETNLKQEEFELIEN